MLVYSRFIIDGIVVARGLFLTRSSAYKWQAEIASRIGFQILKLFGGYEIHDTYLIPIHR